MEQEPTSPTNPAYWAAYGAVRAVGMPSEIAADLASGFMHTSPDAAAEIASVVSQQLRALKAGRRINPSWHFLALLGAGESGMLEPIGTPDGPQDVFHVRRRLGGPDDAMIIEVYAAPDRRGRYGIVARAWRADRISAYPERWARADREINAILEDLPTD